MPRLIFAAFLLTAWLFLASPAAQAQLESWQNPVVRFSILPSTRLLDTSGSGVAATYFLAVQNARDTDLDNCRIVEEHANYSFGYAGIGQAIDFPGGPEISLSARETRLFAVRIFERDLQATQFDGCRGFCDFAPVLECVTGTDSSGNDIRVRHQAPSFRTSRAFVHYSTSGNSGADIIPVLTTPSDDGFVRLANAGTTVGAAMAAVNIGEPDDILVVPNPVGGVSVRICESDLSGQCLTPLLPQMALRMETAVPRYFSLRVTDDENASLPSLPGVNRLYVDFIAAGNRNTETALNLVGQTSVAIAEPQTNAAQNSVGIWRSIRRQAGATLNPLQHNADDLSRPETLVVLPGGDSYLFRQDTLQGMALALGCVAGDCGIGQIDFLSLEDTALSQLPSSHTSASRLYFPSASCCAADSYSSNASHYEMAESQWGDGYLTLTRRNGTGGTIEAEMLMVRDSRRPIPGLFPRTIQTTGHTGSGLVEMTLAIDADGRFETTSSETCQITGQFLAVEAVPNFYTIEAEYSACGAYFQPFEQNASTGFAFFHSGGNAISVTGALFVSDAGPFFNTIGLVGSSQP